MIGVLNFKPFQRGSIVGFFDLRYHGLTVKGCRLMDGKKSYWMAFPQKEGTDKDGKIQYFDQIYLTKPEVEHVRRLVVVELEAQGHIQRTKKQAQPISHRKRTFVTPEGEDLSENLPLPADDDIPW